MPNRSKQKGGRFEREIVHYAETLGLKAHKIPLSGAVPNYPGDINIAGRLCECKKRHKPIAFLEKNLKPGIDALIIGGDYSRPLVVVRLEDWLKLL